MKCKVTTTILIGTTAIGLAAIAIRAIRLTGIALALGGITICKLARKKEPQSASQPRPTVPYANRRL